MFKCDECDKEFKSYRGLNGHKRIHGQSNGSYSNPRKTQTTHYNCLNCGQIGEYHPATSRGKFCSSTCQHDYNWKTIYVPLIECGQSSNKRHLKKYIKEVRGDKCEDCGQLPIHNNKPLTLQLDHVDGDSDNDILSNLRLLCPNCHTQTPTFCSKKNSKGHTKQTKRNIYLRNYQNGVTP